MKKYVVVSAVGRDRPGFVNEVTHLVHNLGGNIELQRSTRMAEEYALIVLFSASGAETNIGSVIEQLKSASLSNIAVQAREATALPGDRAHDATQATLVASGADQPGIIDAVTLLLYKNHVNIESMNYDTEGAPFTGEHLFKMTAELAIPAGTDVDALRAQLEELEGQMNFDVALTS